jgi:hypothetical protein
MALEDAIDAGAADDGAAAAVKALALEHGFVTDFTSLVLLLPQSGPWQEGGNDAIVLSDTATATMTGGAAATQTTTWTTTSGGPDQTSADTLTTTSGPAMDPPATTPGQETGETTQVPAPGLLAVAAVLAMIVLARRR